jgi:hypothetical protein
LEVAKLQDIETDKQEKSKKHLWKKGESGNPLGRKPKGQTMTDILRQRLVSEKIDGMPAQDAVVMKLIELAMTGDVPALKYLIDRIDGSPVARQEMTGSEGEPLDVRIHFGRP